MPNLIAVLRAPDKNTALDAAKAAFEGGLSMIEVTFTVPNTLDVIEELAKTDANIGCGTVMQRSQLANAKNAGAQFAVSPHLDFALINGAKDLGIFYLPGVFSPTEMVNAANEGADGLKLFPASQWQPKGLKTLLAPLNNLPPITVTGGVSKENLSEWFQAGAETVCVGSNLFRDEWLAEKNFDQIRKEAQSWKDALNAL